MTIKIKTTQTTGLYVFEPVEGFIHTQSYGKEEDEIIKECTIRFPDGVEIVRHCHRYFEFHIKAFSLDGRNFTDEIKEAVAIMLDVCEDFALNLKEIL